MQSEQFIERLKTGQAFEDEVEAYCAHYSLTVARNGTEHTHPEFVSHLRGLEDSASKFIRFAPDGVALLKASGVIHWEAKASINLEKDAYETYVKYQAMGCSVCVFFKDGENVYKQFVDQVGFIPSDAVVGRVPPRMRYPIDEDDWITPRKSKSGKRGSGSGTPYKEVDAGSLELLPHFYNVVYGQISIQA